VRVETLDLTTGWKSINSSVAHYDPLNEQIVIPLSDPLLAAGGRYRLTVASPLGAPIADALARPLRPMRFAQNFALEDDGSGSLRLVTDAL